jgi:hypothetical protein
MRSFFHHAFKHSQASIMSSVSRFLSGVRSFLVLLNTLHFGRYRRIGQGIKGVAVEVGNVEEGIVERERNAAAPLLRRLKPESESESMIGGSEVYSHRKSRKMG